MSSSPHYKMLMKKPEVILKKVLKMIGLPLRLKRYPFGDKKRRIQLLNYYKINKILDVGANKGQFAEVMRDLGYKGKIISFEPLSSAFQMLKTSSNKDKLWEVHNFGIGSKNEKVTINISKNSFSSSILDILDTHVKSYPDSVYIDQEEVEIKTLDSIFGDYFEENDRILLKIDTQGYEKQVLLGAEESLKSIKGIQLEMSLIPLYKGESLFMDLIKHIQDRDFSLQSIETGSSNHESGKMMQMEGIFYRE
jgi:FkbM family methyltransferase